MPIYRKHRLIHIHVPKTAGTAIEELFHDAGDMVWGPASWVGQAHRRGRWWEYQHLTLTELRFLARESLAGFESFAVVRDPYARLLSEFDWRRAIHRRNPDSDLRGFDCFAAFLTAIPEDIDSGWDAHAIEATQAETNFLIHVRPQHHYLTDPDGAFAIDRLVRFERLREELAPILGPRGLGLCAIRQTAAPDLDRYDPALLARVNRLYARDFELLGYPRR